MAKRINQNPVFIAEKIKKSLEKTKYFNSVNVLNPGFINLVLKDEFLMDYIKKTYIQLNEERKQNKGKIIIDYGGPNIAKPLHVGHLRSAIIGESLKRIGNYIGYDVIGDVHLGDWGLQIGLIMCEMKERNPSWSYFNDNFNGLYPANPPFTIEILEEIYPFASIKAKKNINFLNEAKKLTKDFQQGNKGLKELWSQILDVSINDLKKNYSNLDVNFELWKKESDAQKYIPQIIKYLKDKNYSEISEGAVVVPVSFTDDKRTIPPFMVVKTDGATLYSTTDLATIVEREEQFSPQEIIYVVDKRQELHFEQVFRCAYKTKLFPENKKLSFIGFGTMNGTDGKPFKTRDGGVLKLSNFLITVEESVKSKMLQNNKKEYNEETMKKISLAAIKYADLSNQPHKNYIFDIKKFTSFEGNTGPYILYSLTRIKSILKKSTIKDLTLLTLELPNSEIERQLYLELTKFEEVIKQSFEVCSPHKICQYVYTMSNLFNSFYHKTNILNEENLKQKKSWLQLLKIIEKNLEVSLDLLGLQSVEKM